MEKHPFFNLKLHTDDELEIIVKQSIVSRQTIHEWPLSCVQVIKTSSGNKYIYKSQSGPTVESLFYKEAKSSLLANCRTLYQNNGHSVLLLDYIDGTLIDNKKLTENELVQTGRLIVEEISQIRGKLPCYQDISSIELWQEYANQTIEKITQLLITGRFTKISEEKLAYLTKWASSKSILNIFKSRITTIHGDATGDNIFFTSNGFRIIDWQRPLRAPAEIDLVALLESQNVNSIKYINTCIIGIFYFTRLAWATECQTKWIPEGTCYDSWVNEYTDKIIQMDSN